MGNVTNLDDHRPSGVETSRRIKFSELEEGHEDRIAYMAFRRLADKLIKKGLSVEDIMRGGVQGLISETMNNDDGTMKIFEIAHHEVTLSNKDMCRHRIEQPSPCDHF